MKKKEQQQQVPDPWIYFEREKGEQQQMERNIKYFKK